MNLAMLAAIEVSLSRIAIPDQRQWVAIAIQIKVPRSRFAKEARPRPTTLKIREHNYKIKQTIKTNYIIK